MTFAQPASPSSESSSYQAGTDEIGLARVVCDLLRWRLDVQCRESGSARGAWMVADVGELVDEEVVEHEREGVDLVLLKLLLLLRSIAARV